MFCKKKLMKYLVAFLSLSNKGFHLNPLGRTVEPKQLRFGSQARVLKGASSTLSTFRKPESIARIQNVQKHFFSFILTSQLSCILSNSIKILLNFPISKKASIIVGFSWSFNYSVHVRGTSRSRFNRVGSLVDNVKIHFANISDTVFFFF